MTTCEKFFFVSQRHACLFFGPNAHLMDHQKIKTDQFPASTTHVSSLSRATTTSDSSSRDQPTIHPKLGCVSLYRQPAESCTPLTPYVCEACVVDGRPHKSRRHRRMSMCCVYAPPPTLTRARGAWCDALRPRNDVRASRTRRARCNEHGRSKLLPPGTSSAMMQVTAAAMGACRASAAEAATKKNAAEQAS